MKRYRIYTLKGDIEIDQTELLDHLKDAYNVIGWLELKENHEELNTIINVNDDQLRDN